MRSVAGSLVSLGVSDESDAVVIVFLPLAFSPICTSEISSLRSMRNLFTGARVTVQVVTVDSSATLAAWARSLDIDFDLLSDFWPHGEAARQLDAFDEERGTAMRKSVLIEGGRVTASIEAAPGASRTREQYEELLAARIRQQNAR